LGSSWKAETISEIWRVTDKLMLEPVFSAQTGYFDKSEGTEVLLIEQSPEIKPGETVRDWKIGLRRKVILRGEEPGFEDLPGDEEPETDTDAEAEEEDAEPEPIVEETELELNLLWDERAEEFFVADPKTLRLMDLDLD
jgi:hypothetical protein